MVDCRPEEADRPEEAGHTEAAEVDRQATEDGPVTAAVAQALQEEEDPAMAEEETATTTQIPSGTACPPYRA